MSIRAPPAACAAPAEPKTFSGSVRHAQFTSNGLPPQRMPASSLVVAEPTAAPTVCDRAPQKVTVSFHDVVDKINKSYTQETIAAFASADELVHFALGDADVHPHHKAAIASAGSVGTSAAEYAIIHAKRRTDKKESVQTQGLSDHINGILAQEDADTEGIWGKIKRSTSHAYKDMLRKKADKYYEGLIKDQEKIMDRLAKYANAAQEAKNKALKKNDTPMAEQKEKEAGEYQQKVKDAKIELDRLRTEHSEVVKGIKMNETWPGEPDPKIEDPKVAEKEKEEKAKAAYAEKNGKPEEGKKEEE